MSTKEVKVPDIGDFKDVPVIEILVKPGDVVKAEDPLVTLESDKATLEVPAPFSGTVTELLVTIGGKVSEGTPILKLQSADAAEPTAAAPAAVATAAVPAPPAKATPTVTVVPLTGAQEVTVPDIGDFKDVPVIEILVKPGDVVKAEDPLVTLESDKATLEVPAPFSGTVTELLVTIGGKVSQGTPILKLQAAEAGAAAAPAQTETTPATGMSLPSAQSAAPRREVAQPASVAGTTTTAPAHASPAVRAFARELSVDVNLVPPTGLKGRVLREDVLAYVKTRLQSAAPSSGSGLGLDLPPWPQVDFTKFGDISRIPLSRLRKISGPNLARNWVMIPHVTNFDEADVTDLEAFRREINDENAKGGVKVTMLAFLIKAAISTLQKFPEFNSSLAGDELILKNYYHIGFAADTPSGLVVPVIRDADKKGILQIATEMAALAAQARDGKLKPTDMQGGCFSISSLGGIGGTGFTPIINAPEVAILGAVKAEMKPVWNGTEFRPRLILPVSLSWDHRVVDGASAGRFLRHLTASLGDFRRILL